ncbi:MAG: hypothetical protein EOP24_45015 [Hyphomicrobiales bacterium]|nr:MAG: hypothetical protein EOP24_45015 [Hyphomicrobiales bacterium]
MRTVFCTDSEIGIAAFAHRLQRHWRTVDAVLLEEVAGDLWADQALRELAPSEAAVVWLEPVASCWQIASS